MKKSPFIHLQWDPVRSLARATLLSGATLALLACTSTGIGSGTLEPGDAPVTFSWTSTDSGISGTMSAVIGPSQLPGTTGATGGAYSGPFLQVTSSLRTEAFEPMWRGWRRGWNDWGYWGMVQESAFTTLYSGKVIANLKGPANQSMRCRFHLNTPAAGMRGGGQGECQFNAGRTIDAVFPHS